MSTTRPVLAVVPVSIASAEQADGLLKCLVSLWSTTEGLDAVVVDDASPATELVDQLALVLGELGFGIVRLPSPQGRAAAVNVGLRRALDAGQDALVVDPGVELVAPGWLPRLQERTDTEGRPAAVVGARLVYGNGLLQHAGMFFSLLRREFFNRFRYGPADLPEALVPTRCPVSQALVLVRHETLEAVGLLDEALDLGHEGVDHCLRVFAAGLECIYEPAAVARHGGDLPHGGADAARGAERSGRHFNVKWAGADFTRWVPEAI